MERSIRYNIFLLIWRAFNTSFHLIIVFPNIDDPSFSQYKPFQNDHFWKIGNMQELYSHIDKNSGESCEDTFLVTVASTSHLTIWTKFKGITTKTDNADRLLQAKRCRYLWSHTPASKKSLTCAKGRIQRIITKMGNVGRLLQVKSGRHLWSHTCTHRKSQEWEVA